MITKTILKLGVIALGSSGAHAAVVIDSAIGNGGFVAPSNGSQSSIAGWTASDSFFLSGQNSPLTTDPFGADSAGSWGFTFNKTSLLTSNQLFSVSVGESVSLSFDLLTFIGNVSDGNTTMSVRLIDTGDDSVFHDFGTLNTEDFAGSYAQQNFTTGVLSSAGSDLALRFDYAGDTGVHDFRMDRVHLAVVPEPSVVLLGGIGLLALLRRRR